MPTPKTAVLLAASLLMLSGCGSNTEAKAASSPSRSAADQKAATSIGAYLVQSSNGTFSKSDAACMSRTFVDDVGRKTLVKAKLLTSSGTVNQKGVVFDKPLADSFADSYFTCVDYAAQQAKNIATGNKLVDPARLEACLRKDVPEKDARTLISGQLQNKPDAALAKRLYGVIQACQNTSKKAP